jgi:hypothetical protein
MLYSEILVFVIHSELVRITIWVVQLTFKLHGIHLHLHQLLLVLDEILIFFTFLLLALLLFFFFELILLFTDVYLFLYGLVEDLHVTILKLRLFLILCQHI